MMEDNNQKRGRNNNEKFATYASNANAISSVPYIEQNWTFNFIPSLLLHFQSNHSKESSFGTRLAGHEGIVDLPHRSADRVLHVIGKGRLGVGVDPDLPRRVHLALVADGHPASHLRFG
jgi:hypothetical protein